MTAEQAVIAKSPMGVSEHDMPGGWRVIVARTANDARTYYHHSSEPAAHIDVLRKWAREFVARQAAKEQVLL